MRRGTRRRSSACSPAGTSAEVVHRYTSRDRNSTCRIPGTCSPNRRRVVAMIHLKRVYEEPSSNDGVRVLVERLWPRGLTKERAAVDLWLKDVAPSPELREW